MPAKTCAIILGDVVRSSNTQGVQQALHNAVNITNDWLPSNILAPFEITRGDEIALVTEITADWFGYLLKFIDAAEAVKLRWVCVFDDLTEGFDSHSSAEMIGPGFVNADAAMKHLKKTSMLFAHQTKWNRYDQQISGIINMYITMFNKLTQLQREVLRLYQQHGTQQMVASVLGKSQQQIQYTLQSIQWETFTQAETAIASFLQHYIHQLQEDYL
ncbi:hypothetical protein JW960_00015 [candidate division KSB1 bacterium]|nr:hypothetical protein [candidate division KSB1 bacterium]